MADEKTEVVEATETVVETPAAEVKETPVKETRENKKFDPKKWGSAPEEAKEDKDGAQSSTEDKTATEKLKGKEIVAEKKEPVKEEVKQPVNKADEDFDGDIESLFSDKTPGENKGGEEKSASEKEKAAGNSSWEKYSKELGIEAKDEAEFISKVKENSLTGKAYQSQPVVQIERFLALPDNEFFKQAMKNSLNLTDEKADEYVKDFEETYGEKGVKLKITEIKSELEGAKNALLQQEVAKIESENKTQQQFLSNLDSSIGEIKNIYGIPVTDELQSEINSLKEDFKSGKYKDLLNNPKKIAELLLWEKGNKKLLGSLVKKIREKGESAGAAKVYKEEVEDKVLNKSVAATKGKGNPVVQEKGSTFNVEKFMGRQ